MVFSLNAYQDWLDHYQAVRQAYGNLSYQRSDEAIRKDQLKARMEALKAVIDET